MRSTKYDEYYEAKIEEIRASRKRVQRDPVAAREYARAYAAANPHKRWERSYRARARQYDLPVVIESFTRDEMIAYWGNGERCIYCDGPFQQTDHLIPVSAGGPHVVSNVAPSCRACNAKVKPQIREVRACEQCGAEMPQLGYGRVRRYCSGACRQRGYRARRARSAIPVEMTSRARWVRHDAEKVPLTIFGGAASVSDPRTWTTYTKAAASPVGVGLGFVLGDGIGCIDLDHCIERGRVVAWAQEVIDEHRGDALMIERSRSGQGVHIFLPMAEGPGRRIRDGRNIEMYSRGRYIAVTGDLI